MRNTRRTTGSWAILLAGLVVPLLLGSDCDPARQERAGIYAITGVPPSLSASLIEDEERGGSLQLTRGAVLAVAVWSTCLEPKAPIRLEATPADRIVIYPLYRQGGGEREFVLYGTGVGSAELRVVADCVSATYSVQLM